MGSVIVGSAPGGVYPVTSCVVKDSRTSYIFSRDVLRDL